MVIAFFLIRKQDPWWPPLLQLYHHDTWQGDCKLNSQLSLPHLHFSSTSHCCSVLWIRATEWGQNKEARRSSPFLPSTATRSLNANSKHQTHIPSWKEDGAFPGFLVLTPLCHCIPKSRLAQGGGRSLQGQRQATAMVAKGCLFEVANSPGFMNGTVLLCTEKSGILLGRAGC